MRKIYLWLLICVISSTSFAASLPLSIAFEFQDHDRFSGIIGKAYVTDTAVEVVTFIERNEELVPNAFIYTVLEKRSQVEGVYSVKWRNQFGIIFTGTFDARDRLNPKILLVSDKGITIRNITEIGREMKNKYLPKVDLGR